ncbi:Methionine repressor MetJ domain, partial [Cinara cedri]
KISNCNENKGVFSSDGKVIIYCLVCNESVSIEQKCLLDHHSETIQHINALRRNKEKKKQRLITSQHSNRKNLFFEDLCNAFAAVNIPLHKLGNHVLKSFLEKYTGKSIPDERTLRKNYISNIYKNVMDQIISDIGNNYVYITVDEITDPRGFYK